VDDDTQKIHRLRNVHAPDRAHLDEADQLARIVL